MTVTWEGFARPGEPSAQAKLISGEDATAKAVTSRPKASAKIIAGHDIVAFARPRRVRSFSRVVVPVTAAVLARPPLPVASAKVAEVVRLSVMARLPAPVAKIRLAEPLNLVVFARPHGPKALSSLGHAAIVEPPAPPAPFLTGSIGDMVLRLKAVLPDRWFPNTGPDEQTSNSPVLDGLLSGIAWVLAWLYGMLQYVGLQRRITTATDVNLDVASLDYFGPGFPRKTPESDDRYRARIKANLLPPRNTRASISRVLTDLTGEVPDIFEPADTTDTGGWGFLGMKAGTGFAYNIAGGWGDLQLPFQAFVTAYRPRGQAISFVSGYYHLGSGLPALGGYGVGAIEYAALSDVEPTVSDADINQAIADAAPAATIMWTRIRNALPPLVFVTDGAGNIITDGYGNPLSYN